MSIRLIDQNDLVDYQALIHRAYQSVEKLGIHFAAATADEEKIASHIEHNAIYVLEKENQFISTLSIRFPWGDNPGPFGLPHLGWFATDPNLKGLGYGNQLWNWIETTILIEQLKLPAVTLGTAGNHPWLSQIYIKKGFMQIGQANLTPDHTTFYFEKILDNRRYNQWKKRRSGNE